MNAPLGPDDECRLLLQTVWDLLAVGDHWPSYTAVDRLLYQKRRLDVDAVIARTPESLLRGGRPQGGARPQGDEQLSLTVDGSALCDGTSTALKVVARAAGLAANAEGEAGPSDEPQVEFDEAVAGLAVAAQDLAAAARASGLLLHSEPWTGHMTLWEAGWRMAVDMRARPYAGVVGLETYLEVRQAQDAAPPRVPAVTAAPNARFSGGQHMTPRKTATRPGDELVLSRTWHLGERIGGGGFGQVFRAAGDDGMPAAVKLVPKEPGAARELLFVGLDGVRNVIPVLDSGETNDSVVIVMPLADGSLEDRLEAAGGPLPLDEALRALRDIAAALEDLDGRIVHRDIKPANLLLLDGAWCLSDFGISRYAEASTAPDTHKWSLSRWYAAPEQWRFERATSAVDVYSIGVMAHELLTGSLPFPGPATEDFRDQHLHLQPPSLPPGVPARLAALVGECMSKPPGVRPEPGELAARLERAAQPARSAGVSALADAYRRHAELQAVDDASASAARTERQRRAALADAATQSLAQISAELLNVVTEEAPTAAIQRRCDGGWSISLGPARLGLSAAEPFDGQSWGGWQPPAFDVIATPSRR